MNDIENKIEHAASLIKQADALIIAAGAGMGVDSGLPDYRGNQGFWATYPALGKEGIQFASIASPRAFEENPSLAWGFYGHRLGLYRKTHPHHGFSLLKQWSQQMKHGHTVFTSNVDGQFQRAGFNESAINECHGSIHYLQCLTRCAEDIWSAKDFVPDVDEEHCLLRNDPPICPKCGRVARPNILMFGDWTWSARRNLIQECRQEAWLMKVSRPVVVELGAGTTIPSVRHFGERIVNDFGGSLIRINPRESQINGTTGVGLALGALDGLRAISDVLGAEWKVPHERS